MRKNREYLPAESIYPLMGMNSADPSTLTDPHFSPVADNVNVNKGIVRKRLGYHLLGQLKKWTGAGTTANVTDPIMSLIEFTDTQDVVYLIALTTKRQFYWNGTTKVWVDITKGVNAGSPVEWTGNEDDPIDWAIGVGSTGRTLVITNGKDLPRKFIGTDTGVLEFTDITTDISGFVTCQTVAIFESMLILGNITTTSNSPTTFMWSKPGDFTNFTDILAGFLELTTSVGDIQKILPLGDQLMIYSDNSIDVATYLGEPVLFTSDTLVRNTRLLSGRGVVDIGPYHLYMNEENIYLCDGTRLVKPVADVIRDKYREDIYLSLPIRATGFLDNIENQIYFVIPQSPTVNIVYKLEYDVGSHIGYDLASNLGGAKGNRWVREILANKPQSLGYLRQSHDLTWDDAVDYDNTWNAEAGTWFDTTLRQDFPLRVFGSNGFVYLYDGTTFDDNSVVVPTRVDSIDFVVPQSYLSSYARWIEVELEVKGTSIDVYYSIDRGANLVFVESRTLSGSPEFQRQRFFVDVTSTTFRVSIQNNAAGGYFELRWLRVWLKEGGAR